MLLTFDELLSKLCHAHIATMKRWKVVRSIFSMSMLLELMRIIM